MFGILKKRQKTSFDIKNSAVSMFKTAVDMLKLLTENATILKLSNQEKINELTNSNSDFENLIKKNVKVSENISKLLEINLDE